MKNSTSQTTTKTHELISFSTPVNIVKQNDKTVTWSFNNDEYSEDKLRKTLEKILSITGVKKKNCNLKFEVDIKNKMHKIFFHYNGDKLDEKVLQNVTTTTKCIVDTLNDINKSHNQGISLTPTHDPDITQPFQINNDQVLYRNNKAKSLMNDLLNLIPILPDDFIISSHCDQLQIIKSEDWAPPLKQKVLKDEIVNITGEVTAIQYLPFRKIRIKVNNSPSESQPIRAFEIAKLSQNFSDLINLGEKAKVELELKLSTTTAQYHITKLKNLSPKRTNNGFNF